MKLIKLHSAIGEGVMGTVYVNTDQIAAVIPVTHCGDRKEYGSKIQLVGGGSVLTEENPAELMAIASGEMKPREDAAGDSVAPKKGKVTKF